MPKHISEHLNIENFHLKLDEHGRIEKQGHQDQDKVGLKGEECKQVLNHVERLELSSIDFVNPFDLYFLIEHDLGDEVHQEDRANSNPEK